MDGGLKNEIISCIKESMQAENFSEMKVDLTGTNDKGEGYFGDFNFATVTGTDKDKNRKEIHLAVKNCSRNKDLRENTPVLECYRRETFFYEKVMPTFRELQLERNVLNPFESVPKCYKTVISDNLEAIVLENLKNKGFTLHDKRQPMNLQHTHLILKNYAKLHALAFALRDQKSIKFNELVANYDFLLAKSVPTMGFNEEDKVASDLREAGRDDLAAKYEELTKRGKENIILDIIEDIPRETVITHGDCHNNNFLFEYQNEDLENPLSVVIIDWQLSDLHSPVMDLSYFLYCTSPKESLAQLDELLGFYHSHLTDFLRELGSDVEELFPYSTLVEHWRKYSTHSFIFITSCIRILYIEKEDTPAMKDLKEEGGMVKMLDNIKMVQRDEYLDRLVSIVDHYFSFRLKYIPGNCKQFRKNMERYKN